MKTPGRGHQAHSAVGGAALANVVLAGLGGVSGILAARLLGVEGRGQLAAIQLPGFLISGIAMLGVPDAMTHFARRATSSAPAIVRTAFTVVTISSLVASLAFSPLIGTFLPDASPDVLRLARLWMLLPPATAFSGIPIAAFRALGREATWNVLRVLPGILWIMTLVVSSIQPVEQRLDIAVHGQLLGVFATGVAAWLLLALRTGIRPGPGASHSVAMLKYGLPLALSAVPQTLNISFDQLLLVRYVTPLQLGYYVAAVSFSALVSPVVSAFGIVLFPRMSAAKDVSETQRLLVGLFRPAVASATGLAFGAAVSASYVIPLLFGRSFEPAIPVARVLAPAGVVLACSIVLIAALQGLGRTKAVLSTEAAGLLVNAIVLIALVPSSGIIGAAIASLCSYTTTFALRLRIVMSATGTTLHLLLHGLDKPTTGVTP